MKNVIDLEIADLEAQRDNLLKQLDYDRIKGIVNERGYERRYEQIKDEYEELTRQILDGQV